VPRYDVPKAAPEPLRLAQQFVNTVDLEHEREWLPNPPALREWLEQHGFDVAGEPTEADLRRVIDVREALRSLLRANNAGSVDAGAVATVNHTAYAVGLAPQIGEDGAVTLRPHSTGVDGALGQVLAVVLTAMLDGSWVRLKVCRNCRWAFYDYSKNRSASWCSMQLCGNRTKTRAYRARHRV
jgi:predicted RNA-binding Zn ribbon-like protein